MSTELRDRGILITGGASGIGRATALCCAKAGASLVLADRDMVGCEETVSLVKELGARASSVEVDVADSGSVQKMLESAASTLGRIDGAFNNAGIEGQSTRRIPDWDEDVFDQTLAVNLKGVWLCMKYEIDHMLAQGSGGSIVNTASAAGLVALAGGGAYTASKHGVVGLSKTAALEFSAKGIRVNAVCPGVIETPMVDRLLDESGLPASFFVKKEPIGRLGQPGEIGDAVAWLLSERASLVTGIALPVDGGLVA
jgi:NAD(P)-dependent dehydrogenase (short-subunit alcohol dehydrogenase family)